MNSRKHARLRKIQIQRQVEARCRRVERMFSAHMAEYFSREWEQQFVRTLICGTSHPERMGGTFSNVANENRPGLTLEKIKESMDRIMAIPIEPRFVDPADWYIKAQDDMRERFNWITRL